MELLRIMSVGRPGVGKSTIGNMILYGTPKGSFETSNSIRSCTQDSKVLIGNHCMYVDVPGIPDTDPNNTAKFYNIIIREAKKEINVILFVFKKDRIDHAAYRLAEMLFREINKSNALKILIINDHNNYAFEDGPGEAEYEELGNTIALLTKIDFTHRISLNSETMKKKMEDLVVVLSQTKSYMSSHLQSFDELSDYVNHLQHKKNYEEEVVRTEQARISRLQKQLTALQVSAVGASTVTTLATVSSFFTFGASVSIATSTGLAAASAIAGIQIKKSELEKAKKRISKETLTRAAQELAEACEKFEELKVALHVI